MPALRAAGKRDRIDLATADADVLEFAALSERSSAAVVC